MTAPKYVITLDEGLRGDRVQRDVRDYESLAKPSQSDRSFHSSSISFPTIKTQGSSLEPLPGEDQKDIEGQLQDLRYKEDSEEAELNKWVHHSSGSGFTDTSHRRTKENTKENTSHRRTKENTSHRRTKRATGKSFEIETAVFVDDAMYDFVADIKEEEEDTVSKVESFVLAIMNGVSE